MSNVERSVAYDIVADQPFQPLSLEHDLDMLRLATALRSPDFTLDEQWTEHMNTLVAGSSFRFPNRCSADDPKIIGALQMREEVLNEFGWLHEGSPLRQVFLKRQAMNYPNWQRPDYIVQNLRLFHDAAQDNMMTIVSQNSEFVFRRPRIMAERLIKSWEAGFDTQKIVEASPYLFFDGSLDDFEQNVRRKVSSYGQQVLKIAAAKEIEEKQAERVARVELSPELHQDMITAVTVHKNNPDFVMDSVWFNKLNTLIRKGSQATPNYMGKFEGDGLDIYRAEINKVRSEFLKELGLLEPIPALERLQQELERRKSLPVPLKVMEVLQLFHDLLGKEALRPIREFPRFIWGNATTIRAKLDTVAELTDPAAYLLEHPKDIDNCAGDKLRQRVRRNLAVSRKHRTRIEPRESRQKVLEEIDSSFVPDPNATPKLFSDGLELSAAEMSFQVPGPLSLERDAGWLALAVTSTEQDVSIDQAFIDRLNELLRKDSAYYDKTKQDVVQHARTEFLKAFGWLDNESPGDTWFAEAVNTRAGLPNIRKVVSCMRTTYAYTGNQIMDPIRQAPRLLFRAVGAIGKELAEVEQHDIEPTEALLQRPAFFARNTNRDLSKFSLPRAKTIREKKPRPEPDPLFTIDPNATPKLFSDGLELSAAEMSFQVPGPLSLERDAGWLALATVLRDVSIDEDYIAHLNAIRQKAFIRGQEKTTWKDFYQEMGWEELSSNKKTLSLPTAIQNMRLMFAHLGNMVMAPITKNMVRVLARAPGVFADELSALGSSDAVEEVLTNRTSLLAGNLLKLLEKNNGKLPEPKQPGGKGQKRKNNRSPKSLAAADDVYITDSSEDLGFSAASVINPDRDRTFDYIHQAFAKAPSERQRVLREYAALLRGGIESLIETCPELIDCDEKVLQGFIELAEELAEEPDFTETVLFRKWRQLYTT